MFRLGGSGWVESVVKLWRWEVGLGGKHVFRLGWGEGILFCAAWTVGNVLQALFSRGA